MLVPDLGRLLVAELPHLRRYARALVKDPESADDLVQDCLERAWSRSHLLRSKAELRTWLFTILHNIYVSGVRKHARDPLLVVDGNADSTGTTPPAQEHNLALRELPEALAALDADQRAAVLLVGLEDLSYREAASVLGIPLGTLMSRLHRGRRRLRVLMEGGAPIHLKRVK
jgi:RNA polymerase sigma-70 factor (ECF subfamily)